MECPCSTGWCTRVPTMPPSRPGTPSGDRPLALGLLGPGLGRGAWAGAGPGPWSPKQTDPALWTLGLEPRALNHRPRIGPCPLSPAAVLQGCRLAHQAHTQNPNPPWSPSRGAPPGPRHPTLQDPKPHVMRPCTLHAFNALKARPLQPYSPNAPSSP